MSAVPRCRIATVRTFQEDRTGAFRRRIYGASPGVQALQQLKRGDAFPGVVRDDTQVFTTAATQGLRLLTFDVVLPDPGFQVVQGLLADEKKQSRYSYGFPDGDGDCNCTT